MVETGAVASRERFHRLVDAIPEARLPEVERVLREMLASGDAPAMPRRFASAGALSTEHDLAERSEEILRAST